MPRGGDDDDYSSRRRRRSYSRSRSRSPPPRRRDRSRSRSPKRDSPSYDTEMGDGRRHDSDRRGSGREVAASEAARKSQKENRVYVGNLSFQVRWSDLKDFMREAGNVVFAEIMTLPNGMSKGCGVVEFSTREEAQRAIAELNDQVLLGRPLFIREDREDEARFGPAAISGRPGFEDRDGDSGSRGRGRGGRGGSSNYGGYGDSRSGGRSNSASSGPKQLYVGGLNWEVGWQDLKDLFRQAGDIVRADVHFGPDGNPKGSGSVTFNSASDAQNAISMFDGAELNGMKLEVREERFQPPSAGPFGGSAPPMRGGFREGRGRGSSSRGGMSTGGVPYELADRRSHFNAPPSLQIFVKNLPWSTANEDLVELFQTTGQVDYAEVLYEGGRSKGCGIVQFATIEEAQTSIDKFQGYQYGGRGLNIEFNARIRDFIAFPPVQGGEQAANGGDDYMQS